MNAVPASISRATAPSPWLGISSLLHSARFLWRTPAAWPLATVPVAVCGALSVAAVVLSVHFVPALIPSAWSDPVA